MMTFKAFLQSLPDNISDQDAIKKFNEYKMDFKKQQINDFFLQHKEEEWYVNKYSPQFLFHSIFYIGNDMVYNKKF